MASHKCLCKQEIHPITCPSFFKFPYVNGCAKQLLGVITGFHQLPLLFPNMKCIQLAFLMFLSVQLCVRMRKILPGCLPVGVLKQNKPEKHSPPTFVVEEPFHLHGRPGVSDTEHGTGYDALLSWRAICGSHQAPVWLVVETLQNLHSLASAYRQLPTATITGNKVMDHHCQLAATGQLKGQK